MGEFVGGRIVPKHCGTWNKRSKYEMLSIVYQPETGDSYISRRSVPAGTALSSEEYWAICSEYSAQVRNLEQDVDADVQQMHTDLTQTKSAMRREFSETSAELKTQLAQSKEDLSQQVEESQNVMASAVNNAVSTINSGLAEMQKTEQTLNSRMDTLAKLPSGSTKADAELMDIRVGENGTVFESAGTAVRSQISSVTECVKRTIVLSADGWIQGYPNQKDVKERITLPIGKIGVGVLHILSVAENTRYGVQGYSSYPFTTEGKAFDSGWQGKAADYEVDPNLYYAILVGEGHGAEIGTVAGAGYTVTITKNALDLIDENAASIDELTRSLEEAKQESKEKLCFQTVFDSIDLWVQGSEHRNDYAKRLYLPLGALRVQEGKISISNYTNPVQYGIRGFSDEKFTALVSDTGWQSGAKEFMAEKGVYYTVLVAKKGLVEISPSDMEGFVVTVSTSVLNEVAENRGEIKKIEAQIEVGLQAEREQTEKATEDLWKTIREEITGRQKVEVSWQQGSYTGPSNTDPTRIKSTSAFKNLGEGIVRVTLADGYNAAIRTYNAPETDAPFVLDTGWKKESFTLQFDSAYFRIAVKKGDDSKIAVAEGPQAVDVTFLLNENCLQSRMEANAQGIKVNVESIEALGAKQESLKEELKNIPMISQTVRTIAHRGDDLDAPQNVTAAYIKARQRGHTIAENDLTRTKDGVYVVWHDTTLSRLGNLKDTDGHFLYCSDDGTFFWFDAETEAYVDENYGELKTQPVNLVQCRGADYSVEKMNFSLLKKLDFGAWFSSDFAGEQILTFREWVMLCKRLGMEIYVDKKISYTNDILTDLFGIVRECGMLDKTSWIGLSHAQAVFVRENLDRNARFSILANPTTAAVEQWKDIQQTGRGFFFNGNGKTITQESAQLGLNAGFEVECYYVDFGRISAEQVYTKIRELVDFGLTGITTDKYRVDEAFSYLLRRYE